MVIPNLIQGPYLRWKRGRQRLTVFCLHSVVEQPLPVPHFCWIPRRNFERQLETITRRFQVIPLRLALERLWSGTLDRSTATLTFDDGFRNLLDVVQPILARWGLPATLFWCTGPAQTGKLPWFARLPWAMCHTGRRTLFWRGIRYEWHSPSRAATISERLQERIKRLPPSEVETAADEISQLLDIDPCAFSHPEFGLLTSEQVRQLDRGGLVAIEAHTRHHPILSMLGEDAQRAAIKDSVGDVEAVTGRRPQLFAYPNGSGRDFTDATERAVAGLGLQAAFTTANQSFRATHHRFRLPRVMMDPDSWGGRA